MIETHRAWVARDQARYEDELKTLNEYVCNGLITSDEAKSQIEFAANRIEKDQFLLNVIDGVFV
jgi:hypothetical protein